MSERQLKILAIDDTPANLALLGMALQDEYSVQIATSGAKGLALAQDDPPDLVLLDIMMPDMDGFETCRRFKADAGLKDIPIIFVTALNEKNTEMAGLALGATDYLTKPIDINVARLRIHNLLERERLRMALLAREAEQRLAASVFAHTHDGIVISDADNLIIDVNASFTRITGYQRDEVLGLNPRVLKSGRQPAEFYQTMWHTLLEQNYWHGELWNRHKSGRHYAVLSSISVVRDQNGAIHHFIGLFADITQLKNHEHDLEQIAHFDPLTGIPNRLLLVDRLTQGIAQTRRSGRQMAVCYLDLDGFKPINDSYGHELGDQLLIAIARRITECLRAGDTVARIGGDEFVLLLLDLPDRDECESILQRVLAAVARPFLIDNLALRVSASIGFTLFPDDDADADTLLRHADQAMYGAKHAGKNRHNLFDPASDKAAHERGRALADVERALRNQEFELFFQPKVNMRTGKVLGAEALIRWRHPQRGLLLPQEFLPVAENSDLIVEIGDWVLRSVLDHLEEWRRNGLTIKIGINIAPRHLLREDFTRRLAAHLNDHPDLPASCLELEILETAALADIGRVYQVMRECQKMGVTFALDDFGTGYSSLTYLKALPAEVLKIDQSFIRDILRDPEDLAIVEGIINLSGSFRRQVVAEGVESVEQGLQLLKLRCEQAQGFCIARPIPAARLADWIANWQPNPQWLDLGNGLASDQE
ncbi:EAL domain-containing response regulator [Methylomonas sp. MED-D]|uniref:EAL domain-containing response regulator n=1 Tax=unclassified Methylomonas TaxID=2608980 RepID=UPI0008DB1CC5|nr:MULTISPECIES: EAL domain-containing protein [unclassified Methylomonas]MDT4332365.1 EAL domain-containing protein [Methylomonas sp. MV1]OHX37509.1 diguanylate cyclase [Methylomonas sp. LWB]